MCYWTALAAWMIYGKCLAWRRYACIRRWLAVVAAAGAHRWYALLAAKFCAHRRRSKQTPVECCVNDNVDDMGKQWMPCTFRKRQSASAHSTHNEPTIDFVQMTSKSRSRHRRCVIGHVWTFVLPTTIFDHRRNDEWQCQTPGCGVRYLGMANGERMCASKLPRGTIWHDWTVFNLVMGYSACLRLFCVIGDDELAGPVRIYHGFLLDRFFCQFLIRFVIYCATCPGWE